jgi:hypothetical protein
MRRDMAESIEITLRVDEATTEGACAEPVGPGLYRLEYTPILANREDEPVHAGDVVESEECRRFTAAVEVAGGTWQRVFDGFLCVHLPPESTFDAQVEFDRHLAAAKAAPREAQRALQQTERPASGGAPGESPPHVADGITPGQLRPRS